MKKSLITLLAVLLLSPSLTHAATLTPSQISSIIGLLQAFGADQSIITDVRIALGDNPVSGSPGAPLPTASLTLNGQTTLTNIDPMQPRTWAWAAENGTAYKATLSVTNCDTPSLNGLTDPWTPWTSGTEAVSASRGSLSPTPGTPYYGCTMTATYTVSGPAGAPATARATVTFKHADGSNQCPPGQVVVGMTNSIPGVPICGAPAPTSSKITATFSKTTLTSATDTLTFSVTGLSFDNAAGCLTVLAHPTASAVSPAGSCTRNSDYVYFKNNSRWSWNAANQTWTQTWTPTSMPSVYANGIQVELHWRNMTTGEQKDSPILSVSGIAAAPVSRDLCAEQGLRNAAATAILPNYANLPRYHIGANEALVMPVTVAAKDPNITNQPNLEGQVATVYEGSEYVIALSKNKCDFSQAVEDTGCLAMTGAYNSESGLKWISSTAVSGPGPVLCRPTPGQYWLSMRNADVDQDVYNHRTSYPLTHSMLKRPIVDFCAYLNQRDGAGSHSCDFSAWPALPPADPTPFGTSSTPPSSYTCSNGQVVASASLCPATSYTCSDGTVVSTASACPVVRIPLDPATTPTWGTGPDHWVFFSGPMQSSPPPPVCNNLVYANGSCTKPGLCLTQDGQNRYVCQ